MATLELSIDEDIAVSPVPRTRRLGPLFWAAIAWMIFVFAAAALAVTLVPVLMGYWIRGRIRPELQNPLNRALLILYLDERSQREIAEILGITETNVATKIGRLKERLRNDMSEA